MPDLFPPLLLRKLRNNIPIDLLITRFLKIPSKVSEGYLRFLCPKCLQFNTATYKKKNLARCFRCNENFNPIDMVMAQKHFSFKRAANSLIPILEYFDRVK